MGNYITQADIEDRFGTSTVAKWSNLLEESTEADTDRIAKAIAYGEARVEGYFRGRRYRVPFQGTDPVLVEWCVAFAGWWLFTSRGTSSDQASADASLLNDLLIETKVAIKEANEGGVLLNLALENQSSTVPTVVL